MLAIYVCSATLCASPLFYAVGTSGAAVLRRQGTRWFAAANGMDYASFANNCSIFSTSS